MDYGLMFAIVVMLALWCVMTWFWWTVFKAVWMTWSNWIEKRRTS